MRTLTILTGLLLASLFSVGAACAAESKSAAMAASPMMKDTLAYVGTYTRGQSKGIYLFRVQSGNGGVTFVPLGLAAETASPSFLAVDAKRRLLFAVNEVSEYEGKASGSVSAFSIDPATGKLTLVNQRPSIGAGPCHLLLTPDGRSLIVANYGSGSVTVLRVELDGRLGETTAFVQHAGKSVHPTRQVGPHAHSITMDPAGRNVFVCDLGLDQVLTYRFDAQKGTLTAAEPAFTSIKAGSGPRHMAFRPDGKFAYVINEMSSTIVAMAYDATAGRLTEVQTVSTLPAGFDGKSSTAEIAVHASGKFLYGSNRGHDSLAKFAIDPAKGTLSYVAHQSSGGKTPRNFGLDPTGKFLAIANQDTGNILICGIDAATGRLQPAAATIEAPMPVCVVFLSPQ
ncbi:MAG: lactonase family protein [Opitutus sp.]|nr:lactonase family protein [Opitutus sp.]